MLRMTVDILHPRQLQTVVAAAAASVMAGPQALTLHLSLKHYSDNRYIYDYTQFPPPIPVATSALCVGLC